MKGPGGVSGAAQFPAQVPGPLKGWLWLSYLFVGKSHFLHERGKGWRVRGNGGSTEKMRNVAGESETEGIWEGDGGVSWAAAFNPKPVTTGKLILFPAENSFLLPFCSLLPRTEALNTECQNKG